MSEQSIGKTRGTVRINLEVSSQVKEQIKELKDRSDATTLAEVFRKALALYDLALDHSSDGGKIIFEGKDGQKEVIRFL